MLQDSCQLPLFLPSPPSRNKGLQAEWKRIMTLTMIRMTTTTFRSTLFRRLQSTRRKSRRSRLQPHLIIPVLLPLLKSSFTSARPGGTCSRNMTQTRNMRGISNLEGLIPASRLTNTVVIQGRPSLFPLRTFNSFSTTL